MPLDKNLITSEDFHNAADKIGTDAEEEQHGIKEDATLDFTDSSDFHYPMFDKTSFAYGLMIGVRAALDKKPKFTEEKGHCYDCGAPALFCLPECYWNRTESPLIPPPLTNNNLRCGTCAAIENATSGERIVYLFMEEDIDNLTDEQIRIQNSYPMEG